MDNKNDNKSHNLKLLAVAALLILTPLVSTPLRLKYLYFIVNILVIAVGADAGLLSFLLQSAANKKPTAPSPAVEENVNVLLQSNNHNNITPDKNSDKTPHKCSTDKNNESVGAVKIDKSSSSPSLFFVEGSNTSIPADGSIEDGEKATIPADELVEEVGESGVGPEEELFEKAEMFIGNFYKQLKMQREESWNQLHIHFSHKPSS